MANDVVASKPSTPKPVNLPANNKNADVGDAKKNLNQKCSVCSQAFKTLAECLRHELLTHSLKSKTTPKSPVNNRIKAASKFLNTAGKLEERTKIHNALQNCPRGKELSSILKLLILDTDSLNFIFTRIQTCLEKELSSIGVVKIYPFGSIASGLALRDSDIDIYMDTTLIPTRDSPQQRKSNQTDSPRMSQQRGSFNRVISGLYRSHYFAEVFGIRQARVPIIKCKHSDTGFSIDINVSHLSSLENTQFIRDLVYSDDRIRELMQFLKLWAKNKQIIGNANMTSYCLLTMIVFYLQQPWQIAGQESGGKVVQILKSVKDLQRNCRPQMTEGVNYAFDLQSADNRPKIPRGVTTLELLKRFFKFYIEYNFDDNIISPFHGTSIPKVEFTNEKYRNYANQLATITQYMEGVPAQPFAVDRCMCAQDPFALNQNVARSMLPPTKKYFMFCLQNAHDICQSLNNPKKIGEVLEKLLYDAVVLPNKTTPVIDKNDINLILQKVEDSVGDVHIASKDLSYFMEPRKADLNYILNVNADLMEPSAFLRRWCDHYIEAIPEFLSAFYRIDVQTQMQLPQKQQRLDNENLTHVWHISATVDLWTNRFFQKPSQQTFWEYQMAQTERLHELRRQDAAFSVNLNALLNVRVLPDFKGIIISLTLADGTSASVLCKKDPLRKFFNAIKNTLQNYSFKESVTLQKHNNNAASTDDTK